MGMDDLKALFSFVGGLGLFLYGMHLMAEGLQKSAGEKTRRLMGYLTDNRLFGTDRMLLSLNRRPEATAQELLAQVKEDIDRFVGAAPQFDDITMLCLVNRNDALEEQAQPEKRLQKTEPPKMEGAGKEQE